MISSKEVCSLRTYTSTVHRRNTNSQTLDQCTINVKTSQCVHKKCWLDFIRSKKKEVVVVLIRTKELLLLAGQPHLRLFLRNIFFFPAADTRIKRAQIEATMLSRYVQKSSRINYKKPTKSGIMNGG